MAQPLHLCAAPFDQTLAATVARTSRLFDASVGFGSTTQPGGQALSLVAVWSTIADKNPASPEKVAPSNTVVPVKVAPAKPD
jgi:hypothetical protein